MKTSFKNSSPNDLYVRLRYAFPCTPRSRPFACLSSLAFELLAFYTLAILAVNLQLHIISLFWFVLHACGRIVGKRSGDTACIYNFRITL